MITVLVLSINFLLRRLCWQYRPPWFRLSLWCHVVIWWFLQSLQGSFSGIGRHKTTARVQSGVDQIESNQKCNWTDETNSAADPRIETERSAKKSWWRNIAIPGIFKSGMFVFTIYINCYWHRSAHVSGNQCRVVSVRADNIGWRSTNSSDRRRRRIQFECRAGQQ